MSTPRTESRPRAYVPDFYQWNIRRVPASAIVAGIQQAHPARHCAVFVVHGMGEQQWTSTAASLRDGMEDALEAILEWQTRNRPAPEATAGQVPAPFIYEGFWANYPELKETFPADWALFNEREQALFESLWHKRSYSVLRTIGWLLMQQVRLLSFRRIHGTKNRVGLTIWCLYLMLQIIIPAILLVALVRAPRVITRILADVRLYAAPKGIAERAIVQRIDYRVGREFLRLIGLDWDFRRIPAGDRIHVSEVPIVFKRVIWVSHSLGSVISYNVLSDLFNRAEELERSGDRIQQRGVIRFRHSLRRFVTLGSPLNKFAALFPQALRPWSAKDRHWLVTDGDTPVTDVDAGNAAAPSKASDWWINFYNVHDPVSGALYNEYICGDKPPISIHTRFRGAALIPGLAHTSYWSATEVLRFILGRTYGPKYLPDKAIKRQSIQMQKALGLVGYLVWAAILIGLLVCLYLYVADLLKAG